MSHHHKLTFKALIGAMLVGSTVGAILSATLIKGCTELQGGVTQGGDLIVTLDQAEISIEELMQQFRTNPLRAQQRWSKYRLRIMGAVVYGFGANDEGKPHLILTAHGDHFGELPLRCELTHPNQALTLELDQTVTVHGVLLGTNHLSAQLDPCTIEESSL